MSIRTPLQARALAPVAPRKVRQDRGFDLPADKAPGNAIASPAADLRGDSLALDAARTLGSPRATPSSLRSLPNAQSLAVPNAQMATASMGQSLLDLDVRNALRNGDVFSFRGTQLGEEELGQLQKIERAVAQFRRRPPEIAASLLQFQLGGKSANEIHGELIALGFVHHRAPLNGRPQPRVVDRDEGRPVFEKVDGARTLDPRDPDIVMERTYVREDGTLALSADEPDLVVQDLYVHPDGGMVRVKPQGDPSSLLRPEPHASRSVLLEPSAQNGKFDVLNDSGWHNEGFKVDDEGNPAPKAPNAAFGMRPPRPPHGQLATRSESYSADFTDALMSAVHINLPPES